MDKYINHCIATYKDAGFTIINKYLDTNKLYLYLKNKTNKYYIKCITVNNGKKFIVTDLTEDYSHSIQTIFR